MHIQCIIWLCYATLLSLVESTKYKSIICIFRHDRIWPYYGIFLIIYKHKINQFLIAEILQVMLFCIHIMITHAYACMNAHIHTYIYIYMYIYTCVYIYIYIKYRKPTMQLWYGQLQLALSCTKGSALSPIPFSQVEGWPSACIYVDSFMWAV